VPVLAAVTGLALAGCESDVLIGIEGTINRHPGGIGDGSGGSGGVSGGTGGAAPGNGGSGGSATAQGCHTISTTPGQPNYCGRTTGLAYSPDGQLLASVTENLPYLHIWRLSDGLLLSEPSPDDGSVAVGGAYGVAFSPDGTIIATSGNAPRIHNANGTTTTLSTNTVNLWDAATGALLKTLPTSCGTYASGIDFSHDGTRLVTAGMMGNIEVWSLPAGTRTLSIPFNGSVYTAHFSPDDSRLITAAGLVGTVWNAATGAKIFDIPGLEDEMNEAAFSPDGQRIVATADNGKVKVLDAAGTLLQTLTFKPATTPYFSHAVWIDSARFVIDDWSGAVKEWTADGSGTFVPSRAWAENMQTLGMAVSPDRTTLVVSGSNGFVFLSPQTTP